jgi:hypothetical protein
VGSQKRELVRALEKELVASTALYNKTTYIEPYPLK